MVDKYVTITIDTRARQGLSYNDEEKTLDIVAFGDRYLQSHVEQLAYVYDSAGGKALGQGLHIMEGTPGTGINTQAMQLANAHARTMAIPLNNFNFGLMDPMEFALISADVKSIQHEQIVGQSLRQRYQGMLGNWMLFESVHIEYLETAAERGTPLTRGANQSGDSIASDGWTASEHNPEQGATDPVR